MHSLIFTEWQHKLAKKQRLLQNGRSNRIIKTKKSYRKLQRPSE